MPIRASLFATSLQQLHLLGVMNRDIVPADNHTDPRTIPPHQKQYPDTIAFFRLGDFYETFDDDAKTVANVRNIVLTGREMGGDARVPLAGVPYHAVETYLARLINAGYKVAIFDGLFLVPKWLNNNAARFECVAQYPRHYTWLFYC